MAALFFWSCLILVTAVYLVYPGVMFLLGRRPIAPPGVEDLPSVTIVIAARNEAPVIRSKLRSCLHQEYPSQKLDIVLASDGSDDETVLKARREVSERLRIVELPERLGKSLALNTAVAEATGTVIVFTDARQRLDPHAVRRLVAHFGDPSVGCVSGDLRYEHGRETGLQKALHNYWGYERRIRLGESRIHSCVGATGALYAIRRDLWQDLPPDLILDDVYTPMQIVLKGYRAIFDPRAWASDQASVTEEHEYGRRVRTLTGNYQLLFLMPRLLSPRSNPIWAQFAMHKLGRLATPIMLVGMLVGAAFAAGPPYPAVFGAQVAFWVLVLVVGASRSRMRFVHPFALPYAFAVTQGAALQALVHCVQGNWDVWKERA